MRQMDLGLLAWRQHQQVVNFFLKKTLRHNCESTCFLTHTEVSYFWDPCICTKLLHTEWVKGDHINLPVGPLIKSTH